ncbi:MAG: acyl-CoA dehydrogenase family protein [Acidimicrobiaceae bacterium]|nr:acyl-CoA dehydrogenase family protein [Acidimicrobiaceae bacterium]MCY4175700.1 acyl-CoA dehydrogenase family protein [Acidimicrobiaceae bacterium]MCY4280292.1 acyl-CoA dehydrogenase family protein [Acidimicrobiaceae bacterium]MCY4293716.1 acyl-CoA dehydrogenase family protein [Acidimicrobiaceae bacterium]
MTETLTPPAADIDADTLRAGVVEFCAQNWDPDLTVEQWWRLLAESGYAHPMLPSAAGGLGYGQDQAALVSLVLAERGVLGPPGGLGRMLAAPTIAIHGAPEQIRRFVPEILDGRVGWCQLFSEPNAGSDLAGLQCRAERDGDEWVITGQKVWTSGGQVADKGMLLARTDPDLPKHAGISWFAFDMDQPGVEVRPLKEMTGHALFNEVFIDEARVADSSLIGGLNNGWRVGNTTLMVERASLGSSGRTPPEALPGPKGGALTKRAGDFVNAADGGASASGVPPLGVNLWWWLVGLARNNGAINSRVLREDLMRLYGLIEINRLSIQRAKAASSSAAAPNIAKLAMSEMTREFRDIGMRVVGADGMLSGESDAQTNGHIAELALFSPAPSIYGGTDQVQRNIIGERVLGLPKEPGPSRDTPFSELPKN